MRTRARVISGCCVLAWMTLTPSRGKADAPSLDARTWLPSVDPRAGTFLEPVVPQDRWVWNAALALHVARDPLAVRSPDTVDVLSRPVRTMFGADLGVSLGLGRGVAVGAHVPLILYQEGQTVVPEVVTTGQVPSTAIGDVALHGKAAIVPNSDGGFGLAVLTRLTIPSGARTSFASDGALGAGARLLAEYDWLIFSVQASLGFNARTERRTWPASGPEATRFGDTAPWTFGMTLRPAVFRIDPDRRHRFDLGLRGSLPAGPVGPFGAGEPGSLLHTPVLAGLSDRIEFGKHRDLSLVVGGDVGLTEAVGVPLVRGIVSINFSPRSHDIDGDKVEDDADQCPEIPEDIDGFDDGDGCPEIDDDDDGIVDTEDACPWVKGEDSPVPKERGCPAPPAPATPKAPTVGDELESRPDGGAMEVPEPKDTPRSNGTNPIDAGVDEIAPERPR